MSKEFSGRPPFVELLQKGLANGGFETDDVLAALLPLMRQVLAAHAAGFVAPLNGLQDLLLSEAGQVLFAPAKVGPPEKNTSRVEELQAVWNSALEVVAEPGPIAGSADPSLSTSHREAAVSGANLAKPVFLPRYGSWEHAIGHHDELTDIFSLGQLLASLACGLDFTHGSDVETFAANRTNLFAVNPRINPVLASVIVQMTELNRHKRAPDLAQMVSRLENYREQIPDFDTNVFTRKEFKDSPVAGKRRMIQSHLRDRLFEISRRNRLIYFKPTLQTLNLTLASVPLLLDYRNIKLEQLFVWHPELAATVIEGAPMSLGKYLRFEDAPYIPGVLDKIISEARRDRAEYGFAQLRLVICFLRWNNLKERTVAKEASRVEPLNRMGDRSKESPQERIHSPLLLLPVELTRKKGVRDNYVLDPTTSEAEVNPALRHHLRELYNLNLPEVVDLKETSLDQFYEALKSQIHASEPGVTFNKIDRPRIEIIHEKARQRLDQYQRRLKAQGRKTETERFTVAESSPATAAATEAGDAMVSPAPARETERATYTVREAESRNPNPYSWDFDLCSQTLGNFNYRKMTLVRDYANLIETDLASRAFDTVFSLAPKPVEEAAPAAVELADQHLVISCDATQATAIARARLGMSYIIQGPPGTGKSQTITNLIADYVARGKRVLFVCEKRAAIDVVFHRLRQQGLDELCCLIHDSQTDKKAFIQNLKQTYEKFLGQADLDPDAVKARADVLKSMDHALAELRRFSEAMGQPNGRAGVSLRALLHRSVELRADPEGLAPEIEELLPDYPVWLKHSNLISRLRSALAEVGQEIPFAEHPFRWLGPGVLRADRPIEALGDFLDQAEDLLEAIESALELTGLPGELWDTFGEIQAILGFAVRARPLAERRLLGVLSPGHGSAEQSFRTAESRLDEKGGTLAKAREKSSAWRDPLSFEDAESALQQARAFEKSLFRFFQPAYWRLKKTLQQRYDFSRHAVVPAWTKVLGDLAACHRAQAEFEAVRREVASEWRVDDVEAFRALVRELKADRRASHASVQALIRELADSDEGPALIEALAGIHDRFAELDSVLGNFMAEHQQFEFRELGEVLGSLRGQAGTLAELGPILAELSESPDTLLPALRRVPVALGQLEAAVVRKCIQGIYREDRSVSRFEGRTLARRMEQLEKHHREWLALNARCLRMAVRQKFLDHVNVSSLPASQLSPEQKAFKKAYAAGRRDLEHEFGKTMRYKSIRDLAAGETGQVIQDLKPIWLMSPLSVSDTLPLDPELFDVVIFDEASQIPLEEAIPAIYRSHQVIVVGDEMQLPPTTFFASARPEDVTIVVEEEGERVEVDLDSDSFLTQSAQNLPSTLLAWHYRSRFESLISFSNAAFYGGHLYTIPDRQRSTIARPELIVSAEGQGSPQVDALLARSISFHFMENGVYEDRRNPGEAAYIARLVRGLLERDLQRSIGVVAFSEAQQGEIETALNRLAEEDPAFAARFEAESVREENGVFCGLFVKNLENVQGDERDIIIMSVCYGHDRAGRMLMNFGPINQRGGEKRLNVIFSRAKHHMAIVSSIRHHEITNDYNDGANSLKNFLQYAEAVSRGDGPTARRVLENLNPLARQALTVSHRTDAVVEQLAEALRARGYEVDQDVGQSKFRCDLAVRHAGDELYRLGILVDTDGHYANANLLDRYLMQPSILRAFGWQVAVVLTKDWRHSCEEVLDRIEKGLRGETVTGEVQPAEGEEELADTPRVDPVEAPPPVIVEAGSPEPSSKAAAGPTVKNGNGAEGGAFRRFEFVGGSSQKFWEIAVAGGSFTVRFGRMGTAGQSQTKKFADEARAMREAEKLIAEKLKKGYVERAA